MSATVHIPTPLRRITKNQSKVEASGKDIWSLIDDLEASYPGIKERICDENGNIRRFVNIYLNEEDIRFLDGVATKVKDGDTVSIIPAIAGGRQAILTLTLTLTKSAFEEVSRHAQETYPEECCGIILSGKSDKSDASGDLDQSEQSGEIVDIVYRCDNIQNKLHAEDPQKHPRDATIAYYMDPNQLLKILNEAEKKSLKIKAFYHSHPRHEAYFSTEDKARALAWDEPLYPDTAYLVTSVYDRKVKAMRAFAWNEAIKDFSPVEINIV